MPWLGIRNPLSPLRRRDTVIWMSAKQIATATVVVLTIVALAALGYLLLDILLLVFLGIVVAAALQPWHAKLCRWGVRKGAAVLLIYLLFLG